MGFGCQVNTENELEALKREMELPIEELLRTLPAEFLEKPADIKELESSDESAAEEPIPALSPRRAEVCD